MSETMPLVLVVDDQPAIRELITQGVQSYKPDFSVVFAETGEEAREIVRNSAIAAVLLDMNLIGESGASLAEWLHDTYPNLPKAFLTAYDRSMAHENAEEFEMEVWTKPITVDRLMLCIQCLLRGAPSDCDKRSPNLRRPGGPVSMPDVLRKITHSVFFI